MRVVHVRHMGMLVHEPLVAMPMRMRFAGRVIGPMSVLVVRIVHMRMAVLHRLMNVFMIMNLRQVQPHAGSHRVPPAMRICAVRDSPRKSTAPTAPMKGAVEKYAPVRAVPRSRSAMMNRARLTP